MQCPKCNKNHVMGNICPVCNTDSVLFESVVRLSDKLYNKGLARLQLSDFSQGIDLLSKSISANKDNVKARNLLGLALFEIGRVGDAITHWKYSQSVNSNDVLSASYLARVKKNNRAVERLNDTIVMYNQALSHIKNKSDDLAIIQLKKAVDINPSFVDAANLLTLCYLVQNDKDRASVIVERALSADAYNPIAMNYYSLLHPGKSRGRVAPPSASSNSKALTGSNVTYKPVGMQEKKQKNFHLAEILFFVIGALCATAVMFFLVNPATQRQNDAEMSRILLEFDTYMADAQRREENLGEIITQRTNDIEVASAHAITQNDVIDLQDRIIRVLQAQLAYSENRLMDAVEQIDNIDTSDLPFDIIQRIENIRSSAYPRLAVHYNTLGNQAFLANDFHMALVHLEIAHRFWEESPPTGAVWAEHLYQLGRIYYMENRFTDALEMLEPVRVNFPTHRPLSVNNTINSINAQS